MGITLSLCFSFVLNSLFPLPALQMPLVQLGGVEGVVFEDV